MADAMPGVLFLCTHNAGRSQMAAGWLRALGGSAVRVYSGGSAPADEVNAVAVAAMAEVGIDIGGEQPRRWTEATIRSVGRVITMGCGDSCPVYPGVRYEDWEIADPAGKGIEVVRVIRDQIRARVEELVGELGGGEG